MWPYVIVRLVLPIYFIMMFIMYWKSFVKVVFNGRKLKMDYIFLPLVWLLFLVTAKSRKRLANLLKD